eukprot:CAMPEP_0116096690 /NCGR_PEP_ID=MMETSP0327-20121206/10313_1 /TAXON_ID=44447 /ORGANISM="Pseudo-nitzschia delicatissima, Strain B596" /LENGTH=693 /DNA_ID=CAMNT_0003588405 /DNA_START=62 /DNA_END=2143 /DNA_ORIENTATION=+
MPSVEVSRPRSQPDGTTTIEPIKEQRLELGKKVFKAPTQSKRKSSRIKSPEAKASPIKNDPTEIVHHLFLAPTLKRQRKKKLERERKTNRQKYRGKPRPKVRVSDVFGKKRSSSKRRLPGDKMITIILDDAELRSVKKTVKMNDLIKIKHLARRGGVKYVKGLDYFFEEEEFENNQDSEIPPPFQAEDDDPYITPEPGQLISYLWHTRPAPINGIKHIYRTGILCATDGTIRFFESDDDNIRNNDQDRKFFEGRFYLNKQVFKIGNFRIRTDLVEGAICFERERKLPCTIIKIDEECGAVLVEPLEEDESGMNRLWISPDELVGNYKYQKIENEQPRIIKTSEEMVRNTSPKRVSLTHETIDLTGDDEEEDEPESTKPQQVSQTDSLSHILKAEPISLPDMEAQRTSIAAIVADVCESLSSPTSLTSNGYNRNSRIETVYENNKFENANGYKSWLPDAGQSDLFRDATRIMDASTLGSSLQTQTMSNSRLGMMGASTPVSPQANASLSIQSELGLLKQHGMALEMLMSANDVGTIAACLQYIKRMQQRGVPVGPTAAKVVADAELSSRALMEEGLVRHMTNSVWAGGKGYTTHQSGLILCRLSPVLGSDLGRLDSPLIDSTKLLSLGLSRAEAMDVLPYIQSFEDEILTKNLSFKRQLSAVAHSSYSANTNSSPYSTNRHLQQMTHGIYSSLS